MELRRRRHGRHNTKVTVALGAQVTCTIVNTDDTPQLKLVKTVTNNDGGHGRGERLDAVAAALLPTTGATSTTLGGSGSFQNVFAGVEYTLSENPNPGTGYSSTGEWSCDGGIMNATNTKVTVALGAQVTCTIVNTDDTPQLKLVKDVVNNNDGRPTADNWTLSAAAAAPNDGRNFNNAGRLRLVPQRVRWGRVHAVRESEPRNGLLEHGSVELRRRHPGRGPRPRSRSRWASTSRARSSTPTTRRS